MSDPITTSEFESWYSSLPTDQADLVDRYVELLVQFGVTLDHPYSSGLGGGIRELRIQSVQSPIRVFYAFDSNRDPVLLLGGNKKGQTNEARWTRRMPGEAARLLARWEADPVKGHI